MFDILNNSNLQKVLSLSIGTVYDDVNVSQENCEREKIKFSEFNKRQRELWNQIEVTL